MMNNRIETFLAEINMSPSLFADAIGVQRATVSHILSGRNNPSLDFVQKVMSRFPKLNPDWILSGNGDIWRGTAENESEEEILKVQKKDNLTQQPALFDDFPEIKDMRVKKESYSRSDNAHKATIGKRDIQDQSDSLKAETPDNENINKKIQKVIILYTDQTFQAFTEF